MTFSGFTSSSPLSYQLDAGAVLKDYDVQSDTWETAKTTKLIGATQGGSSFSAVPTVRKVEFDGVKGNVKGLEAVDEWVVTLTVNVKELTAESLKTGLGMADIEASTPAGYTHVKGRTEIALTDYINNITWVGRLSGEAQKPIIIQIKNALSLNGLTLSFEDKKEAIEAITFTAHYTADDLETPPFDIYWPEEA